MSAPVPAGDAQGAGASRATLDALAGVCERAAAGDLEARVVGAGGGDPGIARLARAINAMLDTADAFVREASAAMENGAQDRFHRPILLRGLKGAYRQSAVVINAAAVKMRERRDEIGFVERLAGQNVESVADVARACGELAESSSEIARRAAGAAATTRESVSQAGRAAEAVAAMNDVVRTIDGFVGLIQRVAKQTNLLALNATIEAARAGAAGKGFAVVAAEVKDLSKSTADATGDIRQQVQKIQETAREVGRLIEVINASVLEVDASAAFISRAVEQQVRATSDITRSIDVVSHNTEQVSARIRGAQAAGPASGGRARR